MPNISPGMIKPLRLALLYGHLIARGARLYHPGGSHPVCSLSLAKQMVAAGLLHANGESFELTQEGRTFAG
ncbi:hypothetical protein GPL17_26055 [Bradyrhizobium yuanmingense]|uniref:hypothetical protein n=2 Tax=Nitrobacteraceae TaxID=41294 RepID=UPI0012F9D8D6|nr:hypothetical protein [Bradyrhizobium sp. CCBAU 45321]MDA9543437.1 hypothetical protein [Bradyrhizobium sp. CCBAU 45321]MVT53941.1 hypothetical protein [Bradyrhizobium yuanmingense]